MEQTKGRQLGNVKKTRIVEQKCDRPEPRVAFVLSNNRPNQKRNPENEHHYFGYN
jgi:hypothetical protein